MASRPDKKENRQSREQISAKQKKPLMDEAYDPLSEESTDYGAPGEKFETFGEGENLDRNRLDQPRRDLESLPKAHKEKGFATRRPNQVNEQEEKKLFEQRQKKKKVA